MPSHVTTFGKQYITATLVDVVGLSPFAFNPFGFGINAALTLWRTHQSGLIQIAGNAYAALTLNTSNMEWTGTGNRVRNKLALAFRVATGDWGTITHLGVGGTSQQDVRFWIKLASPITIENGDRLEIDQYDLIFTPPA